MKQYYSLFDRLNLMNHPILPCVFHSIGFLGIGWAKMTMTKQEYYSLLRAKQHRGPGLKSRRCR